METPCCTDRADWHRELSGVGKRPPPDTRIPAVPFKAKAACRRHIPKQQHRVINWAAYDASLRARGSLTVWFTTEAIEALRLQSMGWAAAFPRRRPHRDRLQYRRAKHAPGCSQ